MTVWGVGLSATVALSLEEGPDRVALPLRLLGGWLLLVAVGRVRDAAGFPGQALLFLSLWYRGTLRVGGTSWKGGECSG